MEESEENLSSEDINYTKSPSVINKPKKRSLVERELETSLTARVISPISAGDGVSTSRYGRARRLKHENSESEKSVKMLKSPKTEISPKSTIQSPVYKMHASNSPIKLDSQKPEPFESQIENIYSENNSLSRFGSAEKKTSPTKRYPKVYIRKDLIQIKDKDKNAEETVVLIKNMFSPVSAQKAGHSSLERSMEKKGKRKLSSKDTQSVVKTLDFDEKQTKNDNDKSKKGSKNELLKSEVFDLEAKSEYQVGDLAWARMGTYPFWPCIVTREPGSGLFVKTKLFGRTVRKIFNVTFFGDNGRRSWIVDSMLRQFLGQLEFESTRKHFTSEAKKKDPKLYAAFFISEKKMPQWLLSVEEAETLLREPKRLRIDILSSMLVKVRPEKVPAKSEKSKKVTRTDSDVSLSESLYDTLFSEDDSKGNDSDRRNKRKQSLDVSEVVTACLDNMAAKTGMTKIQRQSHMDRWLLKAKNKTPEKSHSKSQAVQKATNNARTHRPTNHVSKKSYRFRNRHNESQSSDSSALNDNSCEASTSSHYKPVLVAYDDLTIENSNDRINSEANESDNISKSDSSNKKILENDSPIFKSPESETDKTVSNEHTINVLNKIKQSIDSDENMTSTSSADVSGMSALFEISRVDTQFINKEIVESDPNKKLAEVTDYIINENILCNDIDGRGPITSSPKNILKDIEVSAEDLSSDHANKNDQSEPKIIEDEKTNGNISINKDKGGKSDKNIHDNNSGVNEKVSEDTSNFREDKKIKTRQKVVNCVVDELIDTKESCIEQKSNVCELNKPNTRSKNIYNCDENIDLGSDKLKLNKAESLYNGTCQKITPKIAISHNTHGELQQRVNSSDTIEDAHKPIIEIRNFDVSRISQEQKSENKERELHLENKLKEEETRNEEVPHAKVNSEAININGPLNIPETIINNNYSTISSKCSADEKKCEEIVSIDNSTAKDTPNDVKMSYNNPIFQKYLELKQDSVMDEHPELSQDEITSYLYKTWQYETKDIVENKVSTANKTPAKGTNYKALDKERGRRKLVRKKPADFNQDKTKVSPINKSPVNGYHKEIKPIIISPKTKIIFLPRNNIIDSVKNNKSINDFKTNSTLITKVQTPAIEHKGISGSSDEISKAKSITDMKNQLESELLSVTKVERAIVLCKDNNKQLSKIDDGNRNDTSKLTFPHNKTASLPSVSGSNPDKLFFSVSQSNKMQSSENLSGTRALCNKKLSSTENKTSISQNGFEDVTNRAHIKERLIHDYDDNAIECKTVNSIKSISETIQNPNVCQIPPRDIQVSSTVLKTETLAVSKKKEQNTVNNIEHTTFLEKKIQSSENKCNGTEVQTETKELEVNTTKDNVLQNCVAGSNLKERENIAHVNVLSNNLQSRYFTTEKHDAIDCHNNDQTYENANEVKCLSKSSNPAEQNVNSLSTPIHEKKIKETQKSNEVKCKENNVLVNVSYTLGNECHDNTEYDNKNSQLSVQEKVTKDNSSNENDLVHSKLRNSESNNIILQNNSESHDTTSSDSLDIKKSEYGSTMYAFESTKLDKDKKQQNTTLDETDNSTPNRNKVFMENYKTKLTTQEDLSSSKQHKENFLQDNPKFQKYVELKQDSVTDEHPELSHDEVIQYLYKTWLYEVKHEFKNKNTDEIDQTSLVQGVATINANNDKKRKKLSLKKSNYSTDKKKTPLLIDQFLKRGGFQEQIVNVNPKSDIEAIEFDSKQTSQYESSSSSKISVSDCRSHEPDVKNNEEKPKAVNKSTVYEPKEVNDKQSNFDHSLAIKSELPNIATTRRDNFDQSSSCTDGQSEVPLSIGKQHSIIDQGPSSSSTTSESEIPLSIRRQRDSIDKSSSCTDGQSEISLSTRKQFNIIHQSPSTSSTVSESEIPLSIRKQRGSIDQSSSTTEGKSEIPLSTRKQLSIIDQSSSSSSIASESEIPLSIRKHRSRADSEMPTSTGEQTENFDRCVSSSSTDSQSESPPNIRRERDNFDQCLSRSSTCTESEIPLILRKQRDNVNSPSSRSTVSESEIPLSARKKRDTIDPSSSSTANKSEMAHSVRKQSDHFDTCATSSSTDSTSESPLNVRKKRNQFDQWASSSSTASESELPLSERKKRDNSDKCASPISTESKSELTLSTRNQDDTIDRSSSRSSIATVDDFPLIASNQRDNTDKSASNSSTASEMPLSAKKQHDNFDQSSSSTDSETEMPLSTRKQRLKQKSAKHKSNEENKKALMEPEFVRYLELRQDSVIDEHPELSHEEVIQYLYKTWHYEEFNKSEKKITNEVDQTSLVKGVSSISSDKDKRRKKLSRKRPSDFSDTNKKPTTLVNKFLMQNGYHEYHEKSFDASDSVVSPSITKADQQKVNEIETDTDNDVISFDEELKSQKDASSSSTDSESETPSEKKQNLKEKRMQADKKKEMMDAEFVRYLELRQDYVMDEHPELTEQEITNYLYKTWLYEEKIKNDKKKDDEIDQTSLVKGVDIEQKKPRRKYKMIKEDSQESFKVSEVFDVEPKEKSKRSAARPYYNEEISDIEEELALFEIFRKKKPKSNVEQQNSSSQPTQDDLTLDTEEVPNIEDYVYNEMDMVEMYFEQLTTPKPNVFKGLVRERVCEICEKVSNLVKCKTCHGMFHAECVKNQNKTHVEEKTPSRGRKKKKKYRRRIKNPDDAFVDDEVHSDEKTQDGSDPNLSLEAEREPIVVDAEDFEAKASAKMREILGDLDKVKYEYESTSVAISWNARPGKCQVVDVKLEIKPPEELIDASNFKCNDCEKCDTPKCFVCKAPVSPKERVEYRQKCQVAHCYKYYHLECLAHWPQTQFNGGDVRNKSKEGFEAMSCPRHVCHTCVSDDPRGCKTRFSGDKLARCIRCPATYHSFTKCLPAGSQILTGSQIICPRHYEHRPGKVPCHVNTGWCFICALGGTLICCEYCPTSFHAECLNIDPPEGGYMCEDCETGRLPLYGEMVWVKLGHYRWWPGIILHPSQIPANIMAVKHSQGEFVVRFFGQYDHYWVNRGRVFPFQEGDTGKISSQKSKIDSAFTLAVEHASRACEILKNAVPNDEESQDIASSLLPPHYVKLKVNKPVGSLINRRIDVEESSLTQCECDPSDAEPCGPYSQCLNRMLLTECGPTCRAGERCNNRAFEKRQYPKMAPYRTPHRGWGLRCLEEIKAGQFVIEYVGELLDEAEFQRRMRRKHEVRDENYYFLTLDKERMIDAGPKGNLARFMNHSCEPNCETQKWTVLGDVRVGLFAIDDIPANSELTFNYNLESAGIEKKQCMCGAKRCSGYIGAKPKQSDPQPKKNKMVKKIQKKTKKTDAPQQKRPRGRPCKPKELTEIEKDLLIIKNATNASENDIMAIKNSSVTSESEFSERCSLDSKDGKGMKRKHSSPESLTLCLKRVKTGEADEFRID